MSAQKVIIWKVQRFNEAGEWYTVRASQGYDAFTQMVNAQGELSAANPHDKYRVRSQWIRRDPETDD